MEDIFEIKFPIEQEMKEKVVLKFSNKQGGDFNIFSYYWQCFVWAATIGFLRNERRSLASGVERIFSLNTMRGNGGDKDAQALICMCIARTGSVEIMKKPTEAVQVISEYANGGFYHILSLMENGENTFNDFEKVKQEIFSRNYQRNDDLPSAKAVSAVANSIQTDADEESAQETKELSNLSKTIEEDIQTSKTTSRWSRDDITDLKSFYKQMTIEQLAGFLSKSEDDVMAQIKRLGLQQNG